MQDGGCLVKEILSHGGFCEVMAGNGQIFRYLHRQFTGLTCWKLSRYAARRPFTLIAQHGDIYPNEANSGYAVVVLVALLRQHSYHARLRQRSLSCQTSAAFISCQTSAAFFIVPDFASFISLVRLRSVDVAANI